MGITLNCAYLMMAEGNRRPFHGAALLLGRQEVLFSHAQLRFLADHARFQLSPITAGDPQASLSDEQFFQALGFDQVRSLEHGAAGLAHEVWDLNHPVPEEWHEQHDFIYD